MNKSIRTFSCNISIWLQNDANVELPEPKHVRAENNKIFYFDVGHNERGTFVRISEVKQISGSRSSIAVPMSSWGAFRDVLAELQEKMTTPKSSENESDDVIKTDPEQSNEQ